MVWVGGEYSPNAAAKTGARLRYNAAVRPPASIDGTVKFLEDRAYVADRGLATALFLSLSLSRPLFLEGEAGVGKTEVARVLAAGLGRELIRLQCYEGLDTSHAVYEWNYARQMLALRRAEVHGDGQGGGDGDADLFSERFLIERPLLRALRPHEAGAPVLLIDELDRADEPFEAFLLEVLADFQITIPETGTVRAPVPPPVVITSNRTREIHDAVKRRCFYCWLDYPSAKREMQILARKAPGASHDLSRAIVAFVQQLRGRDLFKAPGIAETIDWAHALVQLDAVALAPDLVNDTLGVLLKYQDDIARMQGGEAAAVLAAVQAEVAAAQ